MKSLSLKLKGNLIRSNFSKSKKTTQNCLENPIRTKENSFVKSQFLNLKGGEQSGQLELKAEIKSEEKLIGLEFPSTMQFEAGPEYEIMVSRMLDPCPFELLGKENFMKRSLKQSNLSNSDLQTKILNEDYNQRESYQMSSGSEINPENEDGPFNYLDIREYLKFYARDADHLCQLLIEQKMGKLDIMDKISEEQSKDLDNSFVTHGINNSMVFGKDAKLMHSDSLWMGTQNGRKTCLKQFG